MRKRFLFLLLLAIVITTAWSQEITRKDADSMLRALKASRPDITRIDLLLNLAQFHIFKPGEHAIDFDSAMNCINEASVVNKVVKSPAAYGYQLLTESYLLNEKGEKEKAKKTVERAITFLERENNKGYLGKAYYELSNYYNWQNEQELVQKTALVEKSVEAFDQARDLGRKAASLKMLGDLLNLNGVNERAIEVLKLSLLTYDSVQHKPLQGVYTLLARTYTDQSDYRQALHYALLALKTAEAERDNSMQLCQINNDIGLLYNRLKEYTLSIKYYKDALEIAKKHNESTSIILLMTGIAAGYNSIQQPEKALEFLESVPKSYLRPTTNDEKILMAIPYLRAYLGTKDPGKGQKYCDILLKLASNQDVQNSSKITTYRTVAEYYMKLKNYPAARLYLSKNKVLLEGLSPTWISLDLRLWYKLDSAQGRFRDAYNHLRQLKIISDSIFNATKAKQLQQLEVEYETAKKEDSIRAKNSDIIVLTQKNQLQQANLKQSNLIKNVTIAGIIVAFVFIGLIYRQYRLKQRSNDLITHKNEQLQHFLTEKEWLLKEIHHRVKNNLQIVMSLLNSQSAYIDNVAALTAIHDSQHRVHAMSLIHQKLYGSDNVSSIDMAFYIRELVSYLSDSFDTGQRIRFDLEVESLELDVSQAVPLGLILNEAITNAIKYAFPKDRNGIITISLSSTTPNNYLLTISDNGIGMPLKPGSKTTGSLGMSLMSGLAEDLDGKFTIENDNGTRIKISFVHDLSIKRPAVSVSSFVTSN